MVATHHQLLPSFRPTAPNVEYVLARAIGACRVTLGLRPVFDSVSDVRSLWKLRGNLLLSRRSNEDRLSGRRFRRAMGRHGVGGHVVIASSFAPAAGRCSPLVESAFLHAVIEYRRQHVAGRE